MTGSALTHLLAGGVLVAASLPLIRRRVKPNGFYGIRVPAAFASEENWYAINAYGGRLMLRFAALLVVVGAVGLVLPVRLWWYDVAALLADLGCLLWVVGRINRFARTLPQPTR